MCGKAYDPRFIFAWPTARYAVMSGASAANTLVEIKIRQLERGGKKLSEQEKQDLLASIKATYEEQTDCRYAAARLWVDAIIDPAKTREALMTALEAASLNPDVPKFNPGILQTLRLPVISSVRPHLHSRLIHLHRQRMILIHVIRWRGIKRHRSSMRSHPPRRSSAHPSSRCSHLRRAPRSGWREPEAPDCPIRLLCGSNALQKALVVEGAHHIASPAPTGSTAYSVIRDVRSELLNSAIQSKKACCCFALNSIFGPESSGQPGLIQITILRPGFVPS